MASEISANSFWNLLRQSGLVADDPLAALTEELNGPDAHPLSARQLAEELVRRNVLTQWQADMLMQGKHRGFRLGPHRILRPLGHGGMSKVFLAEHEFMRRRCAIKVLPAKYQDDADLLNRFHLEARAIAALDHPHIVRAYDFNKDVRYGKEIHYLVMEYVEGQDLRRMVEEQGPLECRKAADLISQAAEGLAHAHELGFVHRDVKPANLLVDPNGVLKILDLGLARFTFEGEQAWQEASEGEQSAVGTADYVAPEQVLDPRTADRRADIYSLGHTLYFLLTGRRPFPKSTLVELLKAHQSEKPEPILKFRPDVPLELTDIYERMTSKKPAQRFQTAQEVVDALQSWLKSSSSGREYSRISALMQAAMRSKNPTGTPPVASAATGNTNLELAFLDDEPLPGAKQVSAKPIEPRDGKPANKASGSSAKITSDSARRRTPGASPAKSGAAGKPSSSSKSGSGSKPNLARKSPQSLPRAEEFVDLAPDDLILPEEELVAAASQATLQPLYRRRKGWQTWLTSPWLWVGVGGTIVFLLLLVILLLRGSSLDESYPPIDTSEPAATTSLDESAEPTPFPVPPPSMAAKTTVLPPASTKPAETSESVPVERPAEQIVIVPPKPAETSRAAASAERAKPAEIHLDPNKLIAGVKTVTFRLQTFGDPKVRLMVERQAAEAIQNLDLGITVNEYPLFEVELRGGNIGDGFAVVMAGLLKVRIPDGRVAIVWRRTETLTTMPRRATTDQALKVLRPKVSRFFDQFVSDIKDARRAADNK